MATRYQEKLIVDLIKLFGEDSNRESPFSRLDNQDIRTLAKALKDRFG